MPNNKSTSEALTLLKNFVEECKDSVVFVSIRALPHASKSEVTEQLEDSSFKIRIKAVPEKGKANTELLKFLQSIFKRYSITLSRGASERIKLIKIVKS